MRRCDSGCGSGSEGGDRPPERRKRVVRAAAGVLVVLWCASTAHGQTTLRWKFQDGQRMPFTTRTETVLTMSMGGQHMFHASTKTEYGTWTVVQVREDGAAEMKQVLDRFRLEGESPAGVYAYDSQEGKEPTGRMEGTFRFLARRLGAELAFVCDAAGRISEVKVPPEWLEAPPQSAVAAVAASEQSVIEDLKSLGQVVPADAIAKGGTWSVKEAVETPAGTVMTEETCTYLGPASRGGVAVERIGVKVTGDPSTATGGPAGALKIKSLEAKGNVYFDNEAGRVKESKIEVKVEMEGAPPSPGAPQAGLVTTTLEATITTEFSAAGGERKED